MKVSDGMNYAPKGKAAPVVGPGEFVIAAVNLRELLQEHLGRHFLRGSPLLGHVPFL